MQYLLLKSLHMFSALGWMFGLLATTVLLLPMQTSSQLDRQALLDTRMARIAFGFAKWWTLPCMFSAIGLGAFMGWFIGWWTMPWFWLKVSLASMLITWTIAHILALRRWHHTPTIRPSFRWVSTIPVTLGLGAFLVYVAYAKPMFSA